MRTSVLYCVGMAALAGLGLAVMAVRPPAGKPPGPASGKPDERIRATLARLPLHFEENRGQAGSEVKFLARGAGGSVLLGPTEAVLAGQGTPAVRMKFVGANP